MQHLLHQLPCHQATRNPDAIALVEGKRQLTYAELAKAMSDFCGGLLRAGLRKSDRVAIYLPKTLEAVIAMFGTAQAGGVFVPVNSLLKPAQVRHIVANSGATTLVTTKARYATLTNELASVGALRDVVLTDADGDDANLVGWQDFCSGAARDGARTIDADLVSILYTSGSTGQPKGVMLSHRNMVAGAYSVAEYLENTPDDRLLAVLPFSFDYGFSQLSTAFTVGARVVLLEYLLPRDVLRKLASEGITGLAGVPPLWHQLATLDWPDGTAETLRYFTNSGGAMPKSTLAALRARAPAAKPYLMYGLTEAFRSTYLPPAEVDRRPDSMGKAIPNADILLLNAEGRPCEPGEVGELVHRGSLVSLGYWKDPERTSARFRPVPDASGGQVLDEIAVWSGDSVRCDEDGFLYFVGRRDEMIKTSGYRVSPAEIEEVVIASGLVGEAVAFGVPHPELGQAIVIVASRPEGIDDDASDGLLQVCRSNLANYMQPRHIDWLDALPRNPNGKIDRSNLAAGYQDIFAPDDSEVKERC